jgi:hypothetical protein
MPPDPEADCGSAGWTWAATPLPVLAVVLVVIRVIRPWLGRRARARHLRSPL